MSNDKISWVEKFLWTLYKTGEELSDLFKYIRAPMSWKEALHPEYREIKREYEKRIGRKAFRDLIYYLKKKGLIRDFEKEEKRGWLLTSEGEKRALEIKWKFEKYKKRRDGRWIMIIFDIPEKVRIKRDFFRAELQALGFQMLQKSIWVSPYDILKETKKLIEKYFLGPYTKTLLIEEIQIK